MAAKAAFKSMTNLQRRWLRRRQAVEPAIGHLKSDHRMNRCWLAGAMGDALHTVLCAAGYNLRWLLRAVMRGRIRRLFFRLLVGGSASAPRRVGDARVVGHTMGARNVAAAAHSAMAAGARGDERLNFAGPTILRINSKGLRERRLGSRPGSGPHRLLPVTASPSSERSACNSRYGPARVSS